MRGSVAQWSRAHSYHTSEGLSGSQPSSQCRFRSCVSVRQKLNQCFLVEMLNPGQLCVACALSNTDFKDLAAHREREFVRADSTQIRCREINPPQTILIIMNMLMLETYMKTKRKHFFVLLSCSTPTSRNLRLTTKERQKIMRKIDDLFLLGNCDLIKKNTLKSQFYLIDTKIQSPVFGCII